MKTKLFLKTIVITLFTINGYSQTIPNYVPTSGLVGYYPFNGNANDESSNSNNGTVNGAILTIDRNGNSNSAYSFDGINNYISVPSSEANSSFVNGQTISFWMKISEYPTDGKEHYIINKTDNSGTPQTSFYQAIISDYNNVDYIFYRFAQTANVTSQGTTIPFSNVPLNQWINVCFTTDLTVTKAYVNGVLYMTYPHYSPIGVTTTPLTFGDTLAHYSTNSPYKGLLDDIGIWNRVLTEQEITNLYISNDATFCNAPSGSIANGMVGYYPFCGNANDISGNSNNGTNNGATLTSDRFGNTNSAYSFNGVDEFINVDYSSSLGFSSYTLSAWIYVTSVNPSNLNAIITNISPTPYYGYELRVEPNSTFMLVNGTSNDWSQPNTTYSIPNNTWCNIVATYENQSVKMYINSTLFMSYSTPVFVNNSSNVHFGTRNPAVWNGGWFTGKLDDIGIWNRALTQAEITSLYGTSLNTNQIVLNDAIKVFPNPTSSNITIDLGSNSNFGQYQVKINNMIGQQIYSGIINQQQEEISLKSIASSGLYLVSIIDNSGLVIATKKIIVK